MGRINKSLHQDFIKAMEAGWPKPKDFEEWLRQRKITKSGAYGDMKKGREVTQEFIARFVRYVVEKRESEPDAFASLSRFLRPKGVADPATFSASEVCRLLFAVEPDYLARDSCTILDRALHWIGREKIYVGCERPAQVYDAVCWHYISYGRQLDGRTPPLAKEDAIQRAREKMDIELESYYEKALVWNYFDGWTVLQAWGKGAPTGMSIVLPLTKEAYQEIRNGKRMSYDLAATDLVRPSPYLLLESCFERPADEGGINDNVTWRLKLTITTQVAKLFRCLSMHTPERLTLLSFAASPVVRTRLEANRFTPLGTYMPHTDVELYERKIDSQDMSDIGLRLFLHALSLGSDDTCQPQRSK